MLCMGQPAQGPTTTATEVIWFDVNSESKQIKGLFVFTFLLFYIYIFMFWPNFLSLPRSR